MGLLFIIGFCGLVAHLLYQNKRFENMERSFGAMALWITSLDMQVYGDDGPDDAVFDDVETVKED